jgi:hypothetical protein
MILQDLAPPDCGNDLPGLCAVICPRMGKSLPIKPGIKAAVWPFVAWITWVAMISPRDVWTQKGEDESLRVLMRSDAVCVSIENEVE